MNKRTEGKNEKFIAAFVAVSCGLFKEKDCPSIPFLVHRFFNKLQAVNTVIFTFAFPVDAVFMIPQEVRCFFIIVRIFMAFYFSVFRCSLFLL